MRWFARAVTAFGLLSMAAAALAQDSGAPFGLEWTMTAKAVEALGVGLQTIKSEDGTSAYTATNLPKVLGDIEWIRLDFGYSDKLRKIVAGSRLFTNDPYGNSVKARYEELSRLLDAKYGPGRATHKMGDSIYAEQRYFLSGIQSGRAWHFVNFDKYGVSVELSIRAKDSDTGFWVLFYENKSLGIDFEREKREREKKSL